MQRNWKFASSTLFVIPRYTRAYNMGSFRQTMTWLRSWPNSFALREPCIFVRGKSVLWRVFQNNCRIWSLLFFSATRSHKISMCIGFPFFSFLWVVPILAPYFLYLIHKKTCVLVLTKWKIYFKKIQKNYLAIVFKMARCTFVIILATL